MRKIHLAECLIALPMAVVVALPSRGVWAAPGSAPADNPQSSGVLFYRPGCIIFARRQVTVGSQASGRIVKMPVEEQDAVKAGQLIAQLDDTAARFVVDRLRAAVDETNSESEAKIRLDQAKDDYDAAKKLAGTLSVSEVRKAERNFAIAALLLQRVAYEKSLARIDLQAAEKRLADMTIRAPIDAVVLLKHREAGESVDADTHTPVVTLIDLSALRAEVLVPADKYKAVRLGQRGAVTCDIFPDRTLDGRVVFIEPIVSPAVDQFKVKVEFTDPLGQVRPGMRATVKILEK